MKLFYIEANNRALGLDNLGIFASLMFICNITSANDIGLFECGSGREIDKRMSARFDGPINALLNPLTYLFILKFRTTKHTD